MLSVLLTIRVVLPYIFWGLVILGLLAFSVLVFVNNEEMRRRWKNWRKITKNEQTRTYED